MGAQGSHYIVILRMEGLTSLLKKFERKRKLYGIKVCRGVPPITHLFFYDDYFLFYRTTKNEVDTFHNILGDFESSLGLSVNLKKFEFILA